MAQKSKFNDEIWSILLSPSYHQRSRNAELLKEDELRLTPLRNAWSNHKPLPSTTFRFIPPYFIIFASLIEVFIFTLDSPLCELVLVFDPNRRRQLWRFASYMLLHGDCLHLTLNVVIQCLLAAPLEAEQGAWRTAIVYLGGGLCGSLATTVLEPDLFVRGASAGVYALLISHTSHIILNFGAVRYVAYRGVAVLVITAADVAFTLYHFSQGNICPRIGWAAHSSGALAGLLLGLAIFKSSRHASLTCRALRWTGALILAGGVLTGVVYNVSYLT